MQAGSLSGRVFRSIGVQVVTYHNDTNQLIRLAEAIAASVRNARTTGIERVSVEFGDCAERPTIDSLQPRLEHALADAADLLDTVSFHANLGSGGGSNALAARRDDEVIWVLNPDTYPSPTCASELLTVLAGDGVGAVDGRQIPIEHAKAYDPESGDTSWVSGCCLMTRREAFDEVGGFDAAFFPMYGDDVDFSWRLRRSGWKTRHAPRAAVFHDKRITIGGGVEVSEFQITSSSLARLWLTRRWGRPDLEAETLAWIDTEGLPAHRAAAAEFRRRCAGGDSPEPIPAAEGIAQFVDGEYAVHRFQYQT